MARPPEPPATGQPARARASNASANGALHANNCRAAAGPVGVAAVGAVGARHTDDGRTRAPAATRITPLGRTPRIVLRVVRVVVPRVATAPPSMTVAVVS